MKVINEMTITFKAISVNEGFARACIAAFCVQANPNLDTLTDIKTAVSEAVTNVVVHAYPKTTGDITIALVWFGGMLAIGYAAWYFKRSKEN